MDGGQDGTYPHEAMKNEFPRQFYTVVGVVKTVRSTYLSKADSPFLYFPKPPDAGYGQFLVRTRIPPDQVPRIEESARSRRCQKG